MFSERLLEKTGRNQGHTTTWSVSNSIVASFETICIRLPLIYKNVGLNVLRNITRGDTVRRGAKIL